MLIGDRAKYFGIVAGITFAALLIAQQLSIFCGLLLRTTSQLQDIAEADIWVMDPNVEYVDELKPMKEDYLQRVQGVPGVAWAVHFYKGQARLKLGDGKYQQAIVLGIDDATMVGAPQKIVLGSLADLRQPDAVIMDENGLQLSLAGRTAARRPAVGDERSSGPAGRHLPRVANVSDVSDFVHSL